MKAQRWRDQNSYSRSIRLNWTDFLFLILKVLEAKRIHRCLNRFLLVINLMAFWTEIIAYKNVFACAWWHPWRCMASTTALLLTVNFITVNRVRWHWMWCSSCQQQSSKDNSVPSNLPLTRYLCWERISLSCGTDTDIHTPTLPHMKWMPSGYYLPIFYSQHVFQCAFVSTYLLCLYASFGELLICVFYQWIAPQIVYWLRRHVTI